MDASRGHKDSRERLYPRASSRASTASSANMSMTKSANSSSSHLREGSHSGSHAAHKYHHSHCGTSVGSSRPISRLSGDPGDELREPVTATSSLLQEKLQQERKLESERQAGRFTGDLSASTDDIRNDDAKSSPIKRSATAMGRRERSDGSDEFVKDTGMGFRQMEETMSNLHKQNFDLKLQLFHRKKQQIILESKVETLETRNKEMMDLQESMLSSLQAKDETHKQLSEEIDEKNKALGEAVSLIIKLEARVDELLREREMVRQVEADEVSVDPPTNDSELGPGADVAITMDNLHIPLLTENVKKLGRMPSFLSDRGEETENLRNVVLRGKSSVMRMRKVSESSVDPSEINRIASPLSVLSESSFVSIYGPKEARQKVGLLPANDVAGMDGSYVSRSTTPARKTSKESWDGRNTAPSQMPTAIHGGGAKLSTRMHSIGNILDMDSPLQKLERLEEQMAVNDESYDQPLPPNRSRGAATPTPRSTNPQQQGKSKHEKREALQKVMTNYPTHRDFANSHAFPPTPDTVSSSTLRKHQNFTSSQDSLMRQAVTGQGEGTFAIPDRPRTATRESSHQQYQTFPEQHAFTTNYPNRAQVPMTNMNLQAFSHISQLAQSLPRRPHSAAETTSSRARADSVGSDSGSDGGADAHSEADSFDYWMKESMKPNRYETIASEQRKGGRAPSPDLFSFPADAQGWETDAMFGALRGNGYLGSPVPALKRDPLDEMAGMLQTQQADMYDSPMQGTAPPTPDRRSSLHARTGSTSAVPSGGKLKKNPVRGGSTGWIDTRGRSNSIDSAAQTSSSNRAQRHQPEATAMPGKRNHYPPISGQMSKGRGLGLSTFFKRTGSESFSVPSSATEATFPLPTPNQLPPLVPPMPHAAATGRSTVPPPAAMPWMMRPPAEEDFASATPPPIMRNRGPSLLAGNGGVELMEPGTPPQQVAEMDTPSTPTTVIPPQGGNTPGAPQSGGRRKWLGLGRMGSLKTRNG